MSDEEAVAKAFDKDYSPAPVYVEDKEWDQWASKIEIKVSRATQLAVAGSAGAVLAIALALLNGRVVLKLVQGYKEIVVTVNGLNRSSTEPSNTGKKLYSQPEKSVDTSKADPIDTELLRDLETGLEESSSAPEFRIVED
jgi:hypothetical protein